MNRLRLDQFYFYDEMEAILKEWENLYPETYRLCRLTETQENKTVYLAKITDFTDENPEQKGAYYVQAGVHAQECGGITAALGLMDSLLHEDREILKNIVFYIVPCVNPDGVDKAMRENYPIRSEVFRKYQNEDNILVPEDINGDGKILCMRKKDPLGNMKERDGVMLPREPEDENQPFYNLWYEGYIHNYDGTSPKLGIRNIDFNRSYPYNWMPYEHADDYPFRSAEMRAVAEFMVQHRNIFAGIDFHCGQNGILRPSFLEDEAFPPEDLKLIKKMGNLASDIIGFHLFREHDEYKKEEDAAGNYTGNSNVWMYQVLGISHYVIELGNGFNDIGMDTLQYFKLSDNSQKMGEVREYHNKKGSQLFYPWEPYLHPQLGEVEIGGFIIGRSYYMHPNTLGTVVPKTNEFVKKHAQYGPRLQIGDVEVMRVGRQVYRVRAQVMNVGGMGTVVMQGAKGHLARNPILVRITCEGKASVLNTQKQYSISVLRSMEKASFEWFLSAEKNSSIQIVAEHPKVKCAKSSVIYLNDKIKSEGEC